MRGPRPTMQLDRRQLLTAGGACLASYGAGMRLPRGEALRVLLYLFEREEGVRLLRSG